VLKQPGDVTAGTSTAGRAVHRKLQRILQIPAGAAGGAKVEPVTARSPSCRAYLKPGVDVRFADTADIEGATGKFCCSKCGSAELEAGMISARTKAALAHHSRRTLRMSNTLSRKDWTSAGIERQCAVLMRAPRPGWKCCPWAALCQSTTSLRDSGEVWLVLRRRKDRNVMLSPEMLDLRYGVVCRSRHDAGKPLQETLLFPSRKSAGSRSPPHLNRLFHEAADATGIRST